AVSASARIRAHLLRFVGRGLGGPLRRLPRFVARAKPALEAAHSTLYASCQTHCLPPAAKVFHFRAPAGHAQRILGGGFGRGGEVPLRANVQEVRPAPGPRAAPCSWTLLLALAGVVTPTHSWLEATRSAPRRSPEKPSGSIRRRAL